MRYLPLWIALVAGALIAATIKARRVFGSTDDGPSYIPDEQAEPLETELEGATAAN